MTELIKLMITHLNNCWLLPRQHQHLNTQANSHDFFCSYAFKYQRIFWFLGVIIDYIDVSCKPWCLPAQCTLPWVFPDPSSVYLLKGRLTFATSQSSRSPRLLKPACRLCGICYPLWIFEMNADIWDISISTPPCPALHLKKIAPQLLSLFFLPLLHPSRGPSDSFVPLKGSVTFSALLSQVKNKEWGLNVEKGVIETEVWCPQEEDGETSCITVSGVTEILVIFQSPAEQSGCLSDVISSLFLPSQMR